MHELSRTHPLRHGRGGRFELDAARARRGARGGVPAPGGARLGARRTISRSSRPAAASPAPMPRRVSERAKQRGRDQLGTLGSAATTSSRCSVVDEVFDAAAAAAFGLRPDQVTVLIHTGSRGLGHQVCTDYVQRHGRGRCARYGITLPDRQLACAPLDSPEGQALLRGDVRRRQLRVGEPAGCSTHRVRRGLPARLGAGPAAAARLRRRAQHREARGARRASDSACTARAPRARSARAPETPARYRALGQPVFIPGSMGTASYVLVGHRRGAGAQLRRAPATARGGR